MSPVRLHTISTYSVLVVLSGMSQENNNTCWSGKRSMLLDSKVGIVPENTVFPLKVAVTVQGVNVNPAAGGVLYPCPQN
jgi:hypothetical protein